jgi:hypothetical protein
VGARVCSIASLGSTPWYILVDLATNLGKGSAGKLLAAATDTFQLFVEGIAGARR